METYEKHWEDKRLQGEITAASDYDTCGCLLSTLPTLIPSKYIAKLGLAVVVLGTADPFDKFTGVCESWAPKDLQEKYNPVLRESFWKKHHDRLLPGLLDDCVRIYIQHNRAQRP